MQRSILLVLMIVTATPLLAAQAAAPAVPVAASPKPAAVKATSLLAAFALYCTLPDHHDWFCGERERRGHPPLADAYKWEVLRGYCADSALPDGAVSTGGSGSRTFCDVFDTVPPPLRFQFDHATQRWDAEPWRVSRRKFRLDPVTGIPTAHLAPRDDVGVVIAHTNPLVFKAARGAAREENGDQFDAMANLARVAGAMLPGLLPELVLQADAKQLLTSKRGEEAREAGDFFPYEKGPFRGTSPLDQDMERIQRATRQIIAGVEQLRSRLDRFATLRADLQVLAQSLERGPAVLRGNLDQNPMADSDDPLEKTERYELEDPGKWSQRFDVLRTALRATAYERCEPLFGAFAPLVTLDADKPVEIQAAAARFGLLRSPTPGAAPACDLRDSFARELQGDVDRIDALAGSLAADPGAATVLAELRVLQTRVRAERLRQVLTLVEMTRSLATLRAASTEMLGRDEATRKAAMALASVATRARDAAYRTDAGHLVVSDRLFVTEERYQSSWGKVRVTPVAVSLDSPYADQVTTSRPKEVATSYQMARRGADRFGVAVGVLYTRAASPVYAAADRDPTRNTVTEITRETTTADGKSTEKTTTPELKEIVEKDRESRAGQLAVFAGYRLAGGDRAGVGLQGGLGTSTERPSLHAGLFVNVGKWLVLGGGLSRFRVKALGIDTNGQPQVPGSPVSGADDIRTVNTWLPARYLTASVNLLGIPLFSSK